MAQYIKINTVEELQERASSSDYGIEVVIAMGMLRSSKTIFYNTEMKKWFVTNYIDDTEQEFSSIEEMDENSNIITALKRGQLYEEKI